MTFNLEHEMVNSSSAVYLMIELDAIKARKELRSEFVGAVEHVNGLCSFEIRSMAQRRRFERQREFNGGGK